jgi:hypothetical protein
MPITAAERIRNTRDRKPKRAFYSLFATIIILRNSQKPRDRRIFDRLDMTAQSTVAKGRWGARRCDARGDGRTGCADRRRRGETVATSKFLAVQVNPFPQVFARRESLRTCLAFYADKISSKPVTVAPAKASTMV